MNEQKGVTLIELLVVVAIIGLLTAIAYPSYESHVFKGHRSQAMADMMKIQLTLEEGYTTNGSYDYTIVASNTCAFCETDTTRYHLTIIKGSGMDKYKVIATPQSDKGQTKDECGILYLNAAGVGTAEKIGGGCW